MSKEVEVKEVKALISAIRKELAKTGVKLPHTAGLTAYAKSKGFENWEAFEANDKGSDAKPATVVEQSPHQLDNSTGLYDFPGPKNAERIALCGRSFTKISATQESVPAYAVIAEGAFGRNEDGSVRYEHAAETTFCWDAARTVVKNGHYVFETESGDEVLEWQLVLAPKSDIDQLHEEESEEEGVYRNYSLITRPHLMAAYWGYFEKIGITLKFLEMSKKRKLEELAKAREELGFALTKSEEDEFLQGIVYSDSFLEDHFGLIENHIDPDEGTKFETYGKYFEYVQKVYEKEPNRVITCIDADGTWVFAKGLHFVNRLYYMITEKPLPDVLDSVIDPDMVEHYFEEDHDDEDSED